MMYDQARTLRLLMSGKKSSAEEAKESEPAAVWTIPHRVVVVAGGARGAGVSTVASNLAAEAAHRGVKTMCIGPAIGAKEPRVRPDYYLLDAGSSADFEGIADFLVLVTTPQKRSVTGAYIALKRFRRSDPDLPVGIVVNRAASPEAGATLAERIASAAQSFIPGPRPEVLGWVLADAKVANARRPDVPIVIASPRSPASSGMRLCARRLWARWRPRWSAAA
jgi:MinD-like ATPase involved in chromosome partitioning or flagellar assembly